MSKEFLWPNRARIEARIDKTAFWEKFSESLPDQPNRRKEQSSEGEKVKSLRERLHRATKKENQEKEPEPQPERESKIVILYDGLLSAKMEWNEEKLTQLADWADLRSQVIIRCGQERPKAEYFSLGEVAAWRAFGNPLDFLKRKSSSGEEVNFSTSLKRREIVIRINNQIINEWVRDQEGEFEPTFVEKFNAVLNNSLRSAIWKEKLDQAKRMSLITGGTGLLTLGPVSLGSWLFKDGVRYAINSPQLLRERGFVFTAGGIFLHLFLGFNFAIRGLTTSLVLIPQIKSILERGGDPYFTDAWDLNPLKHLKDGLKGSFYLSTTGRKLVSYKKSHL